MPNFVRYGGHTFPIERFRRSPTLTPFQDSIPPTISSLIFCSASTFAGLRTLYRCVRFESVAFDTPPLRTPGSQWRVLAPPGITSACACIDSFALTYVLDQTSRGYIFLAACIHYLRPDLVLRCDFDRPPSKLIADSSETSASQR